MTKVASWVTIPDKIRYIQGVMAIIKLLYHFYLLPIDWYRKWSCLAARQAGKWSLHSGKPCVQLKTRISFFYIKRNWYEGNIVSSAIHCHFFLWLEIYIHLYLHSFSIYLLKNFIEDFFVLCCMLATEERKMVKRWTLGDRLGAGEKDHR